MRTTARVALAASLLWPTAASADLIDFTKISRGPSDTLVYKGVTISAEFDGEQVSMVAGRGLGMGTDGSFDGQLIYDFDQTVTDFNRWPPFTEDDTRDSWMKISVNGRINSLTLQPYMIIDGPAPIDGDSLHFFVSGEVVHENPHFAKIDFTDSIFAPFAPVTLDFTQFLRETRDLRPVTIQDFGIRFPGIDPITVFEPYLISHNFPDVTFSYGFSITSLDYEPTEVPEPGTLTLLLVGAGGAGWWRRRRGVVPANRHPN